jgi:hypothetical protein
VQATVIFSQLLTIHYHCHFLALPAAAVIFSLFIFYYCFFFLHSGIGADSCHFFRLPAFCYNCHFLALMRYYLIDDMDEDMGDANNTSKSYSPPIFIGDENLIVLLAAVLGSLLENIPAIPIKRFIAAFRNFEQAR